MWSKLDVFSIVSLNHMVAQIVAAVTHEKGRDEPPGMCLLDSNLTPAQRQHQMAYHAAKIVSP